MKATIEFEKRSDGFGYNWTLVVTRKILGTQVTKRFWLGQDAKVCRRMLHLTSEQVAAEIGTNDLTSEDGRNKLGMHVWKHLRRNYTPNLIFMADSWQFAVK